MVEKINRNDPCFCGSGRKYKKCHYPAEMHPESRGAKVLQLYHRLDKEISEYQEKHQVAPPCHKGCSECCYHYFDISHVEFELILWELENNYTEKEIEEVFDRALEAYKIMAQQDPDLIEILERDADHDPDVIQDWMKHINRAAFNRVPCPLLNVENGSCTVYDVRPFICRAFGTAHKSPVMKDEPLCSKILSSQYHAKITPEDNKYREEMKALPTIFDEKGNVKQVIRMYPIFYWFKLYYDLFNEKKINYLYKLYNFDTSMEEGNKLRIERYSQRQYIKSRLGIQ